MRLHYLIVVREGGGGLSLEILSPPLEQCGVIIGVVPISSQLLGPTVEGPRHGLLQPIIGPRSLIGAKHASYVVLVPDPTEINEILRGGKETTRVLLPPSAEVRNRAGSILTYLV